MGAAANYGYGFFYFFDTKQDISKDPGTLYLIFFIFVLPGLCFSIAGFELWK